MISVIVPAHNEEERIEAAVRALLAQTCKDIEIIVVDNASTDATAERVRALPVTLLHEQRTGTMWACEAGRKVARGDIVVRMDADCTPESTWLERGRRHFADRRVVAVTGPYNYVDAAPWFRWCALSVQKYAYTALNWCAQAAGKGGILVGGNSFMRAETLARAGGFNTAITFYGDDTDVAKRMAPFGRIVFDRTLAMATSARRFEREGIVRLIGKYVYHFLKVLFG